MQNHKKIVFTVFTIIAVTVLLGVISDWKYYGAADLLFSSENADEATTPKVKSPKKPDLMVEDIFVTPKSPHVGDTIGIIAKIKNSGENDIKELKVKITDQKGWGDSVKTSIKGDLYRYVKIELKALPVHVGGHEFRIELDSNGKIAEENEDNNSNEFKFAVSEAVNN